MLAATTPTEAADAAWAASDTLHVVAAVLGSRVLRRAADSYDRAARAQYGRLPTPTVTGNSLRRTARLLSRETVVSDDRALAMVTLVARLAALAEAVVELRLVQQHAAQAAAARRAAKQLRRARAAQDIPWAPAANSGSASESGCSCSPSAAFRPQKRSAHPPTHSVAAQAARPDPLIP